MQNLRSCPHMLLVSVSLTAKRSKKLSMAEARLVSTYVKDNLPFDNYHAIFQIAPMEVYAMARFNGSTFAALTLTSDDEKKFTEWLAAEKVTGPQCVEKLLADGFKISCSWIVDQNAFCFSIIGTDATKAHQSMVMTSWADDFEEVCQIAAYKHYIVCDGGKWPTRDDGPRWG